MPQHVVVVNKRPGGTARARVFYVGPFRDPELAQSFMRRQSGACYMIDLVQPDDPCLNEQPVEPL